MTPPLTVAWNVGYANHYLLTTFVALLLTTRRPRNVIGWLMVSATIGLAAWDRAEAYARWSPLVDFGGALPPRSRLRG